MGSFSKVHANAVINIEKSRRKKHRWILDFLRAKERGKQVDMSTFIPREFCDRMSPQDFSMYLNWMVSDMCSYLNSSNPIKVTEDNFAIKVSFDCSFKNSNYSYEVALWFFRRLRKIVKPDLGIFGYIQCEMDNNPVIFFT